METTYSLTHQQPKDNRVFQRSLHAVHKSGPLKPWKKPTAPLPPPPPARVYKVAPVDFKELVQKLTGAGPGYPRRLQDVAPPPLKVVSSEARPMSKTNKEESVLKERDDSMTNAGTPITPLSAFFRELSGSGDPNGHGMGLGLGLSQSPQEWFKFPLSSQVGSTETSTFLCSM